VYTVQQTYSVSSPAAHDVLPWVSVSKPKIGSTSVSFTEHVYLDLCIAVYLNDEFINIPNTAKCINIFQFSLTLETLSLTE